MFLNGNTELGINVIKIFTAGTVVFFVAFFSTPALTHFLYKYKLWRKIPKTEALDGGEIPVFKKFHSKNEVHTPRFGGLLIWIAPLCVAISFFIFAKIGIWPFEKLNFLSRGQTWLPLFTLAAASLLGLTDDILQVINKKGKGLSLSKRLIMVSLIGLIGAWWFYSKLGWETIHIPGIGDFTIGLWYIPFFVITMIAVYSGGIIDGLDGLAGGTFASIFGAFAIIAFFRGQVDLATFCVVILGAILAFLWFNIPPARFYMGESGILGLCAVLTVVAFLTDSVLVLPIIGFLLVMETGSDILQLLSKKFRKKKIFLAAPIHHHFEAKGWPDYKITMRFWVIGLVMATIGVIIRLLG